MVGLSKARVSQLMADNVMVRGDTAHAWLIAYCERLRDMAAGRASSETGGLDLVQERAALAREQRIAQALKNAVASTPPWACWPMCSAWPAVPWSTVSTSSKAPCKRPAPICPKKPRLP